jgi:hypothetical protein
VWFVEGREPLIAIVRQQGENMKIGNAVVVIVCSVALVGLISSGRAQTDSKIEGPQSPRDPISRFLADFSAAVSTSDVKKAEALFLAPDDSADGKNRSSHIQEMSKDWAGEKDKSRKMSVAFTNTTVLVRAEMVVTGEEAHPKPTPVEFKVLLGPDGCKIVSMTYLKE